MEFKFEKLIVYQETLLFVDLIYAVTKQWPKEELFGLIVQLRRAACSIALNIAEGSSRTQKDFKHFLSISRGSCFECVAILKIAYNRKYLSDQEYQNLYRECVKLSKMLSKLKSSIGIN